MEKREDAQIDWLLSNQWQVGQVDYSKNKFEFERIMKFDRLDENQIQMVYRTKFESGNVRLDSLVLTQVDNGLIVVDSHSFLPFSDTLRIVSSNNNFILIKRSITQKFIIGELLVIPQTW